MTFNRECEYALRGMATLATAAAGRPLMLSEIAARGRLPLSFLSKIFQKLVQHGLVLSHRGAERGYSLARDARAISLCSILEAIEGPDLFTRCVFAHHRCGDENPCLAHPAWRAVRDQVRAAFEATTLADLAGGRTVADGPGHAQRRKGGPEGLARRPARA